MNFLKKHLNKLIPSELKSVDELQDGIQKLNNRAVIDNHITKMLQGVLSISKLRARDLMIPRAHIEYFADDDPISEVVERVIENGHSRYPLISNDQEYLGLIYAKDLLKYLAEGTVNSVSLKDIAKPVTIIPETKKITTLLQDFQAYHKHLALVVNEFGEISGLITIEDILEEIVGDISDEFDKEDLEIHQVSKTTYDVLAKTDIEDFNQAFGSQFPEDSDSIGGHINNLLGHIPQRNESFQLDDGHGNIFLVRVIASKAQHLIKLRMRVLNSAPKEDEEKEQGEQD